jgi:hypothetical protein
MEKPPVNSVNKIGLSEQGRQNDPFDSFKESLNFEEPSNDYTRKRELVADKLSLEDAIKNSIEKTNDSYLKILGNHLLSNKSFMKNKYAFIAKKGMQDEFVKTTGGPGHGFFEGFESIDDPKMVIHEAIHVYTNPILYPNEDVLKREELEIRNKIMDFFSLATQNSKGEYHYGLTNEYEFLSELSNKKFIQFLENIPYKNEPFAEKNKQTIESIIDVLKNPFISNFEIVSDLQTTDDGNNYYYTLKLENGVEQNQYFNTKEEADSFFQKKNGKYDTDNLAIATINQFLKLTDNLEKKENILEKQELYKQVMTEVENVEILETDKDQEGNLLAPNGKKSNLPELEWKMTRTPSFIKFFGNWKEKYNREQYDLWLKYQELQSHEDWLKHLNEDIEHFRKHSHLKDEMIKSWQEKKVRVNHRISKLHAELINSGFNIHSYDLDYTKILDENGEPLLLYRGTDFSPDENSKFTIPKKNIHGKDFEVGVFFGNAQEAKHHHEGRKTEGKNSKLYKVFVNGRNFKIFNSKPNYWDNPKDSKEWRDKYDGLWVKQNENTDTRTEDGVNIFDYVAFNPNDILIVDVE